MRLLALARAASRIRAATSTPVYVNGVMSATAGTVVATCHHTKRVVLFSESRLRNGIQV
jgi:hypothetical protein